MEFMWRAEILGFGLYLRVWIIMEGRQRGTAAGFGPAGVADVADRARIFLFLSEFWTFSILLYFQSNIADNPIFYCNFAIT